MFAISHIGLFFLLWCPNSEVIVLSIRCPKNQTISKQWLQTTIIIYFLVNLQFGAWFGKSILLLLHVALAGVAWRTAGDGHSEAPLTQLMKCKLWGSHGLASCLPATPLPITSKLCPCPPTCVSQTCHSQASPGLRLAWLFFLFLEDSVKVSPPPGSLLWEPPPPHTSVHIK